MINNVYIQGYIKGKIQRNKYSISMFVMTAEAFKDKDGNIQLKEDLIEIKCVGSDTWLDNWIMQYAEEYKQVAITGKLTVEKWEHQGKEYSKMLVECNGYKSLTKAPAFEMFRNVDPENPWGTFLEIKTLELNK